MSRVVTSKKELTEKQKQKGIKLFFQNKASFKEWNFFNPHLKVLAKTRVDAKFVVYVQKRDQS